MDQYRRSRDLGRINRRPYQRPGADRERRLLVTLGVGAAVMLLVGAGIGFALGRATAPKPEPVREPASVEIVPTQTAGVEEPLPEDTFMEEPAVDASESIEATVSADEEPPPTPKQLAPSDGAVIDATRVYLRWSKVTDEGPVTYAFEIQDRRPDGTYGNTQVIRDLKETSFSARVLPVRRRWRVWAVDEAGNESPKSAWRYYSKKATPAPAPRPQPQPEPEPETQPQPDPSDETT